MKELKDYVTEIPNFPKKGILFRDITTILSDSEGFRMAIDGLIDLVKDKDFDLVLGTESRGFIFGAPVAYALGKGFILVRKKGKLPRETITESYDLEYGQAEIEIHTDSIRPGQKVVLIDAEAPPRPPSGSSRGSEARSSRQPSSWSWPASRDARSSRDSTWRPCSSTRAPEPSIGGAIPSPFPFSRSRMLRL